MIIEKPIKRHCVQCALSTVNTHSHGALYVGLQIHGTYQLWVPGLRKAFKETERRQALEQYMDRLAPCKKHAAMDNLQRTLYGSRPLQVKKRTFCKCIFQPWHQTRREELLSSNRLSWQQSKPKACSQLYATEKIASNWDKYACVEWIPVTAQSA